MKYINFRQQFTTPIFTSQDIRLLATDITPSQLTNWQKKDYLTKIRGGVYVFNDAKDTLSAQELSTILVEPSYISLESALFNHNLIPEVIFATTAVTIKNNREYDTYLGHFSYQHLKSELYFGYSQQPGQFRPYLIAEPEKALLDFLYLHPDYQTKVDIESLRLNLEIFYALDQSKLDLYAKVFPARVIRLIKLIRNQDA